MSDPKNVIAKELLNEFQEVTSKIGNNNRADS